MTSVEVYIYETSSLLGVTTDEIYRRCFRLISKIIRFKELLGIGAHVAYALEGRKEETRSKKSQPEDHQFATLASELYYQNTFPELTGKRMETSKRSLPEGINKSEANLLAVDLHEDLHVKR